jgi:predicted nucleic acid-binding protein
VTDPPVLVWDASALHHAALADRVDVLSDLASPWRNVTTAAVLEELGRHGLRETVLAPGWLEERRLDSLDALPLLVDWSERLGAGQHHRGEVTVAVACELLGGDALIDDRGAAKVLRSYGVAAHGTVWLAAQAVTAGRVGKPAALDGFFSALLVTQARLPFVTGPEWSRWAQAEGLL